MVLACCLLWCRRVQGSHECRRSSNLVGSWEVVTDYFRRSWAVSPPVLISLVLLLATTAAAMVILPSIAIKGPASDFTSQANDLQTARNGLRGTVLQSAAGIVLILGALATWRSLEVNRRQRLDDEFVKAIELLTKMTGPNDGLLPLLAAHIGAVHTLERVMHADSRNQAAVVAVLSSYIRQFSPRSLNERDLDNMPVIARQLGSRRPSVWWALDVLMRRKPRGDDPVIDLSGADLRYSDIDLSRLSPVHLEGCDLRGCSLSASDGGVLADRLTRWPKDFTPVTAGVQVAEQVDPVQLESDDY